METLRNPTEILKTLSEKSKDKSYKFQRLYRNLYNPEFYLLAYKNISKSQGSMTAGTDGKTIDGMSMDRIKMIISKLRDHSYQPNPARREYIAKKNSNKMRPLGIPSSDDKLVQEIVRMILESIWEGNFSNNSHGFRPKRSCHTALKHIDINFKGAKWFIEGDIKSCFDCFDHHVLISALRKRIDDEYFISLIWKFLKAGYMEQWNYHSTYSGTPQGSGVSPILANIYLDMLDEFIEEYKTRFDKGVSKNRKINPEYTKKQGEYFKACKDNETSSKTLKELRWNYLKTPYYSAIDTNFKRIQYCRYADDFIIGVIGNKKDAERIKEDIRIFLSEKLKLTLSETKTKITHTSNFARFLGYDITISRSQSVKRDKNGVLKREFNGRVMMYVPKEKWVGKLLEYKAMKIVKGKDGKEIWKTMHRGNLINLPDISIISRYNSEIRGLYNYYCMANNVSVLNKFCYIMEYSMYKTFAGKYRTTMSKMINKYKKNNVFTVPYDTKSGKRHCEFYHDGFKRKKQTFMDVDIMPAYKQYERPNYLALRLKSGKCELCKCQSKALIMHHVRELKELSGNSEWERIRLNKRRKSLAVCKNCFNYICNTK